MLNEVLRVKSHEIKKKFVSSICFSLHGYFKLYDLYFLLIVFFTIKYNLAVFLFDQNLKRHFLITWTFLSLFNGI